IPSPGLRSPNLLAGSLRDPAAARVDLLHCLLGLHQSGDTAAGCEWPAAGAGVSRSRRSPLRDSMAGGPQPSHPLLAQGVGRISSRRRLGWSSAIAVRPAGLRKRTDARRSLVSLSLDPPHRSALVCIWMGKPALRNRFFGDIPLPAVGSETFS